MSSKAMATQEEQANINEPSLITSSFADWNLSQTVPSENPPNQHHATILVAAFKNKIEATLDIFF